MPIVLVDRKAIRRPVAWGAARALNCQSRFERAL
jgi:hypothetical protein